MLKYYALFSLSATVRGGAAKVFGESSGGIKLKYV